MRTIDLIVCHHSAGSTTATVADIRREHLARGFSDIGYHWFLHQVGKGGPWTVSPGRAESEVGSHDQGQNANSIGVCLAGDFTRGPVPADAWAVLVATVTSRCRAYGLLETRVQGHREGEPASTPTACPGYSPELLRADVGRMLNATTPGSHP